MPVILDTLIIHIHELMLQDPAQVPAWLSVTKTLIPDFIVTNPKVCQACFLIIQKNFF